MSDEQTKLVRYWIFLGVIFVCGILIVMSDIEYKQTTIIILSILVAVVSTFENFSYYTGYGDKRESIGDFIEKHPIVKIWMVLFCVTILPFMIYKMSVTNNDSVQGYLYFLSILLLIGPVILVSEIERFRSFRK